MVCNKLLFVSVSFVLMISSVVHCQATNKKTPAIHRTVQQVQGLNVLEDGLPKPVGYTNDFEHLYADDEIKLLDSLVLSFGQRTLIQIAIVTIDESMTTKDSLGAFVLKVANKWGVGRKGMNNGVTIGISKGYRTMRIENGYGIASILTDEETREIIDKSFVPGFKEGDYFKGTLNGLQVLMKTLEDRTK